MADKQKGIDDYDVFMKIVMAGDSGVGKTNILSRSARNEFQAHSKPTIGVEFATKTLELDGRVVKAHIWDTAGQERYESITRAYFRGAKGALLVYDTTRPSSFASVQRWLGVLREHAGEDLIVMLVGNKTDLAHLREVPTESGRELAEKEGLMFMETSAADGSNVDKAFEMEIREIYTRMGARSRLQSEERDGPSVPTGTRIRPGYREGPQRAEQRQGGCCG